MQSGPASLRSCACGCGSVIAEKRNARGKLSRFAWGHYDAHPGPPGPPKRYQHKPGQIQAWRRANPDKVRAQKLRQHYGLTLEDFNRMAKEQRGLCAICSRREKLVVDHDHRTGEVRKLLCHKCNRGLGHFCDDPDLVGRALEYLA